MIPDETTFIKIRDYLVDGEECALSEYLDIPLHLVCEAISCYKKIWKEHKDVMKKLPGDKQSRQMDDFNKYESQIVSSLFYHSQTHEFTDKFIL